MNRILGLAQVEVYRRFLYVPFRSSRTNTKRIRELLRSCLKCNFLKNEKSVRCIMSTRLNGKRIVDYYKTEDDNLWMETYDKY